MPVSVVDTDSEYLSVVDSDYDSVVVDSDSGDWDGPVNSATKGGNSATFSGIYGYVLRGPSGTIQKSCF